jgi:hypothetical protein
VTTGRLVGIALVVIAAGIGLTEWLMPNAAPAPESNARGSNAPTELSRPTRIAVLNGTDVVVTDPNAGRVFRISGTDISVLAGSGEQCSGPTCGAEGPAVDATLSHPLGVAASASGVLISDNHLARVFRVEAGMLERVAGTGRRGYSGDGGPATAALLGSPTGLSIIARGFLVADDEYCVIRRVSDGIIRTVAGTGDCGFAGDGGPALAAQLRAPGDVAAFPDGASFLIADTDNGRIRRVDSVGQITTIAGNGKRGFRDGPAQDAQFNEPESIAIGATGDILIVDTDNSRLRLLREGAVATVAGVGRRGHVGDGGPATEAWLNYPMGAVSWHGGWLVADTNNAAVRRIEGNVLGHHAGRRADGTRVKERLSVVARERLVERARSGVDVDQFSKELARSVGALPPATVLDGLRAGNLHPLEAWLKNPESLQR